MIFITILSTLLNFYLFESFYVRCYATNIINLKRIANFDAMLANTHMHTNAVLTFPRKPQLAGFPFDYHSPVVSTLSNHWDRLKVFIPHQDFLGLHSLWPVSTISIIIDCLTLTGRAILNAWKNDWGTSQKGVPWNITDFAETLHWVIKMC